jgi:hypothetical protein
VSRLPDYLTPPAIEVAVQRMVCTACGSETNATCTCGAAYVPAAQRAAEAIKANPGKSDRAIAADIGVNQSTVSRARQSGDAPASPERTGRDGKQYSVRQRRVSVEPDAEPTEQDLATIPRLMAMFESLTAAGKDEAAHRIARRQEQLGGAISF